MEYSPYKKDTSYTYALGAFPVFELLQIRPDLAEHVLLHPSFADNASGIKLRQLCQQLGVSWSVHEKPFRRLSPKENCYVIAKCRKEEHPLDPNQGHLVLVNPSDMGNLGSILRSALGFGFLDVAIIQPAADIFDPKVVRGSMGACFSLRVQRFESFHSYRAQYEHHICYPFMLTGSIPLHQFQWPKIAPPAFVFGNEASGLDADFEKIGTPLIIPHSSHIDSLNLSIAVSIGLYHANTVRPHELDEES